MGRVLRRALGGLLVCGLLVTSFAYYTYSRYLMMPMPTGPPTAAEPASSPTANPTDSPTPTSAPPASETPGIDLSSDPGGRDPGIRLVAVVGSNQIFEVTELVRLYKPVTTVTLVPPDFAAASRDLQSARPIATGLEVRVDDRRVGPRRTVRGRTIVSLGRATDRFEIRYRLERAIEVNKPSSAGRAIGAVGPLVGRMPADLPVAVHLKGYAVSNVYCVRLPPGQDTCFGGDQPNVRVDQHLAYRDALVEVQLDLHLAPRKGR